MPEIYKTKTTRRITPEAFAAWLHAQGEAPSVHVAAWFEALGVAWPPVAGAASEDPTDWAGLVESFRIRKKRTPWSDNDRTILRAEFNRRKGWRLQSDGVTWGKNSSVQSAMALELGVGRSALDRHLGDGPDQGQSAVAAMVNAFTGAR